MARHEVVFQGTPLHLERRPIRMRAEAAPGIEGILGMTDVVDERGAIKRDAVRLVDGGEGIDERGFGVDDQAVKIEDERANHTAGKVGVREST